jgi:DNA anti-recombination protein RmuC
VRHTLESIGKELEAQRLLLADILIAVRNDSQRDQKQEKQMAKKLAEYVAEIQGNMNDLAAKVQGQTTVIGGVKTVLEGQAAQIAALKQQVQDLIDAGGDVTTLEPIVAALQAQEDALAANTQALADATVANT